MNEKIAERIRKLLALSQSGNQHEAALAAARAAELMAEHHIEAATLAESASEPIDEHVLDTFGKSVHWKGTLANGIAYSFGCRAYWSSDFERDRRRVRLIVVGRNGDVDAVRYTFAYLCSEVDRLATKTWNEQHSDQVRFDSARRWKHAFRVGAAGTIARRLREAREEALARARMRQDQGPADIAAALIRIQRDEAELEAYMATLGLQRPPVPITRSSGILAGVAAGRSVEIGADRSQLGRPVARLRSAN